MPSSMTMQALLVEPSCFWSLINLVFCKAHNQQHSSNRVAADVLLATSLCSRVFVRHSTECPEDTHCAKT